MRQQPITMNQSKVQYYTRLNSYQLSTFRVRHSTPHANTDLTMTVLSNPLNSNICTSSPELSISMESEGFKILWNTFRDKAIKVADEPNDTNVYHDKVISLLDTLQKLIFGLDEGRKTIAVKNGALELIVKLSDTLPSSDRVVMSALKATKSCVIKNPTGRQYCRSAGTLKWMKTTLQTSVAQRDVSKAALVEENITTLAAICLGDDLNALQVSSNAGISFFQIYTKIDNNVYH